MLNKCPECELQVSDKALSCPHCGYPMDISVKRKPKTRQHMKLPNGFGQITEIKGRNLRNRFRVMVPKGKTKEGKPVIKILKPQGYFKTYNDAYCALVEYNKNPYELNPDITLIDLYDRWKERYFRSLKSDSSKRTITAAWKHLEPLQLMSVQNIKPYQLKTCILEADCSDNMKSRIKSTLNLMFDFALEFELVTRNPARAFSLGTDIVVEDKEYNSHVALAEDELEMLWSSDDRWAKVVLIQCYSGWRPQELGNIMLRDVDLENWTFTGGMKTKAGKNRTVPIWTGIRDLVKSEYNNSLNHNFDRLFCCDDGQTHKGSLILTYDRYRHRFKNIMPGHKAHDGRKTFITLCKKYNVDEYAIKYMAGHTINDITEAVYTQREKDWLSREIEKIQR